MLMCQLYGLPVVIDLAISVGILEQHSTHIICELKILVVLHQHVHAQVGRPGAHHCDGLGVAAGVHQEHIPVVLGLPVTTRMAGQVSSIIAESAVFESAHGKHHTKFNFNVGAFILFLITKFNASAEHKQVNSQHRLDKFEVPASCFL